MFGLPFLEPPEVPRKNDGRPAVRLEFLKGFVTRDEAVTISGNGCADDWIVIRIRTAGTPQLAGSKSMFLLASILDYVWYEKPQSQQLVFLQK